MQYCSHLSITTDLIQQKKKTNFLRFNCAFRMVQQHVCNIIYAVMNTIVSVSENNNSSNRPVLFQSDDFVERCNINLYIWHFLSSYFGQNWSIHIYPIFSPRTNYVIITWCTVFLLIFGVYHFWNWVMINYWDSLLRLDMLMALNFGIVILMSVVNKVIIS